jgi:hypothetical protein
MKSGALLAHTGEIFENVGHVCVGLLATAAWGALLLLLWTAVVDLAGRTRSMQADIHERGAQIVGICWNGNLMPLIPELRVHNVHERRVVVPDCLGDAVLCALNEHLPLVLHGLDVVGDRGPAILEVFDSQTLCRLLVLQVALELGGVADVELGLVAVRVVGGIPRDAVALAVGTEEGAQLITLGVAGADAKKAHDVFEAQPFLLVAQVVDCVGEARVDVLAGALVDGLRVDDIRGTVGGALALCSAGRCVGGRGRGSADARGRVGFEEGHGDGQTRVEGARCKVKGDGRQAQGKGQTEVCSV